MQPVSAFLFYYIATDGAASVNVSFQVRAKNHLIWFCKLFTNIRGLLFPVQLILGVKSTVFFTPKLFVWYFVYTVQVLSRGYNQCGKHLPACKCLHWEYLHHCWNIVNVFRARMCSWCSPKWVYVLILSLGTVFPRTLPREDTGTHPRAGNIDNDTDVSNANTCRQAYCYYIGCIPWTKLELYKHNIIQTVLM